MKKFINTIFLLLCVCLVSCSDDSNDSTESGLAIIERDLKATAVGGNLTVTLSMEGDEVSSNKSWCTVSLSGKVVTVTLEDNPTLEGRTAVVTVVKGAESLSFPVTQSGNLIPVAEVDKVSFDAHGGTRRIHVDNTVPFTATPADAWLSVQVVDGGTLVLTAPTNYALGNLATTVKLISGSLESEIAVTQTGITLIPEKKIVPMYNAGDKITVKVSSTLPFTVSSNAEWLTVTSGADFVTLTASDNTGGALRPATVTLTSESLTATINVTQGPPVYADYIGNWTLTGVDNGKAFTYDLSIKQAIANSTYNVTGWGKSAVATDSKYAIKANFDAASGLIYITAQENIGVYTDAGTKYNVMFYGQIEMGGKVYYVGGSGYICYIGMMLRDGSVKWLDGEVELQGGAAYGVVGAKYYIEAPNGDALGFNVDSPFMRQPVMTKASTLASARSAMKRGDIMQIATSKWHVQSIVPQLQSDYFEGFLSRLKQMK